MKMFFDYVDHIVEITDPKTRHLVVTIMRTGIPCNGIKSVFLSPASDNVFVKLHN